MPLHSLMAAYMHITELACMWALVVVKLMQCRRVTVTRGPFGVIRLTMVVIYNSALQLYMQYTTKLSAIIA